jgi:hypothetical protein
VSQLLLSCSHIAQELFSNSTHDIAESHRRLSEQRVASGVTGLRLLIFPNSLMPRYYFNLFLSPSCRADNVPSLTKYIFFKRKVFVTISNWTNPETAAKTADVRLEGQMAKSKSNQNLYVLKLSSLFLQTLCLKLPFSLVQPSSHLTIGLYAKRSAHSNILIGINEMEITLSPQRGSFFREFPFILSIEHLVCRYPLCTRERSCGRCAVDAAGQY